MMSTQIINLAFQMADLSQMSERGPEIDLSGSERACEPSNT